jgi:quercetin dioxygenase-like cupin family protein
MDISHFPFQIIDWATVSKERREGTTGYAIWQVLQLGAIRIRKLEYAPGYKADHWCKKGHIIHCLEGEMDTELDDGRVMKLRSGSTYIVGDNCEAHKSSTENGCVLFVVD